MALLPRENWPDRGSSDGIATTPSGASSDSGTAGVRGADAIAEDQQYDEKVSALSHMLGTLDVTAAPEEVARLFAGELRAFIAADAVIVYSFDGEAGRRTRIAFDADERVRPPRRRSTLVGSSSFVGSLEMPTATYDRDVPGGYSQWLGHAARRLGLGSAIAARLDGANGAVGMVVAGAILPGSLGRSEMLALTGLAWPLAMVLERARLVDSLRQQTLRTRSVVELLAALGPRGSFEEIASPVASALRTMFDADHCVVGTIEQENFVISGLDSDVTHQLNHRNVLPLALIEGFDEAALKGYSVVANLDGSGIVSTQATKAIRALGIRSLMRAVIKGANGPIGLVMLGSFSRDHFSEMDARQLAQAVQPLGVTAQYFRELRESELRARRLELANRIIGRLSSGSSQAELAATFIKGCLDLFDANLGAAIHFEADDTATFLAVESNIAGLTCQPWPETIRQGHSLSGSFHAGDQPQVIGDLRQEARLGPYQDLLETHGLYSALRAPLVVENTIGAVTLLARGTDHFTQEDGGLLTTLCGPLALALEKRAAMELLAESERKYRSVVSQAEEMIYLVEPTSLTILDANAFTARSLGYDLREIVGLRLADILDVDPDTIARNIKCAVESGELRLTDRRYRRRDGSLFDADIVASVITYGGRETVLLMARDVSERKALQHQAVQSQKMESLGTMAGYVAHDFNNLLTTILGFAGLIKRSPRLDDDDHENLDLIEDAAHRAAELTRRLLTFARGGLVSFCAMDLREVITETLALCQPTIHPELTVTADLPSEPVPIEGDPGQLQQAVMNILRNACDALSGAGTIALCLRSSKGQAILTIKDDGPGMDEDIRTRIFEPFFSTKPFGSGTGLGMAITYGIVQGHHGTITVASAHGAGTTFTITLPMESRLLS